MFEKYAYLPACLIICICASIAHADDWSLVFDEKFDSRGSALEGWTTFGDARSSDKGRNDHALALRGPGGSSPGYSGAILELKGGIGIGDVVTASVWFRSMPIVSDPTATLACKIEFKNQKGEIIESEETTASLGSAESNSWNSISVSASVPPLAAKTDLVFVLIQPDAQKDCGVLLDDVEVVRSSPPKDLMSGAGTFETNDGGAAGWTAFNNVMVADTRRGRVMKSWGAFIEPYSGSGIQQDIPIKDIAPGEKISASVLAFSPQGDSVSGTKNFAIIRLECRNAAGRPIAHKESRPMSSALANTPSKEWKETSVEMAMPDTTRSVRLILAFIQPEKESGAILFDDVRVVRSSNEEKNLLANGDFESKASGISGWTSNGDILQADTHRRSGAVGVHMQASANTSEPAKLSSTFPVSTDFGALTAEVWSFVPSRRSISGGDVDVVLSLKFTGADGDELDSGSTVIARGSSGGIEDAWQRTTLTAVPPVGVEDVTVSIVRNGKGKGEVWIDDVRITQANSKSSSVNSTSVPIRNSHFDGGVPSASDWDVADGAWSHNGELQYYAPDAIVIEDGNLVITTLQREVSDRSYTSGHISTKGRHEQVYGRWEIRAKLPTSQGMWPAIWLLPTDGSWPPEIDIIELVGKEPNTVHHSFHWGPLRDGLKPWDLNQTSTDKVEGMPFGDAFHDFALEWTPDRITWFVNGKPTHNFTDKIPNTPMFLIINSAIGGFWPGPPGSETTFPEKMEVDRIQIWKWDRKN